MATAKKPSMREKKQRMHNKIPVEMKEFFQGKLSKLRAGLLQWVVVFTCSPEQRNEQKKHKWTDQIWIWDVEKEQWLEKKIFLDRPEDPFEFYFISCEHKKIILISMKRVIVYSFAGKIEISAACEVAKDAAGKGIYWEIVDNNRLFLAARKGGDWHEFFFEDGRYNWFHPYENPADLVELISIQQLTDIVRCVIVITKFNHAKMIRVTFWDSQDRLVSENDSTKMHVNKLTEMWLPVQCFSPNLKVRIHDTHIFVGDIPILYDHIIRN